MDAYADGGALNGWDADTSSEESLLFQELAKSKLFQQLEKIQPKSKPTESLEAANKEEIIKNQQN